MQTIWTGMRMYQGSEDTAAADSLIYEADLSRHLSGAASLQIEALDGPSFE